MSAPQYCNRANRSHNNQKFGHSLRPRFFFFFFFFNPRGGHGRRKILMDSHPYSHETSIFTIGAPHEEVQGRQKKLHTGSTMGKLYPDSPFTVVDAFSLSYQYLTFLVDFFYIFTYFV